jgi:alpha-beta hydrolase superfamily lysophospholipase
MRAMTQRARIGGWIVTALIVAGVLFALGPRPSYEIRDEPVELPSDLDAWLAQSEARFSDLRPDADKRIVWNDPVGKSRTDYAVVYIHGFSSTRMETYPLADVAAKALGANLFYTRLTGHGRSEDAMGEATLGAWTHDALEAYAIGRRLGEKVVLIATSTGGGLATLLAARPEAKDLYALVLISPNYGVRQWNAPILLWPWGEQIARLVEGEYRSWTASNPRQAQHWTMRYPVRALIPMMQTVALIDELDFASLRAPTLIFYAKGDQLVDAEAIGRRFAQFGAERKKLVLVDDADDPAQHVIAGDILSPGTTGRIAETIVKFVRDAPARP